MLSRGKEVRCQFGVRTSSTPHPPACLQPACLQLRQSSGELIEIGHTSLSSEHRTLECHLIYCQVCEQVTRCTIVEWLANLSQAQLDDRLAGCLVRIHAGDKDGQQVYLVARVLAVLTSFHYKCASAPPVICGLVA